MQCYTHKLTVLFCYLLFFSNSSFAGEWKFQPSLSATESYFDNITLVSDESGAKDKELVTQILPRVSLSKKGRRLQLSADYMFGYIKYLGNAFSDSSYNRASVNVKTEAIREHLFINANMSISQQVVDPSRTFSSNAAVISNNRTETQTISLQPRLVNRFGAFANSDLNYRQTFINYSNRAIGNSEQSKIQYSLNSGRWFKQINWFANASKTNSTRKNGSNSAAQARINYNLSRHWVIFAMGRARKVNYQRTGTNSSQYFINPEAGIVWTASRKLKIETGGGAILDAGNLSNKQITADQSTWRVIVNLAPTNRTAFVVGREAALFGERKFFDFTHRTRRTNWSAGYSELLITPQQLRISSSINSASSGFGGGSGFPSGFALGRLVSDDVILRKRLNINANITRRKITIKGSGFLDKGEYQTSNSKDKRYGVNSGLDYNIGQSIKWSNQVSAQRYYFNNGSRVDNIYTLNSSILKKFKKNINTNLAYQWRKRNSSRRSIYYTAQRVMLRISVTF